MSPLKPTKPVYGPEDGLSHSDHSKLLGEPGEFPFTRGIQKDMYRGRLWTMRQYAGFGSAKDSNKRYRMLLDKGQTGLSVAFDLPTQMGFDSDHPMARGEVGKVGVAISSLEDMEILFKDIRLDKISTSMTINSTAGILLALYICVAEKRGIDRKDLRGTIQNDLLKEYIARGTYIYPPEPSLRLITDIFQFCHGETPQWNSISISGYHIREAGSTAAQELAFTLANGKTYVDAALKKGLNIDDFASRLSFFFNVQNGFFEEIAKFRAARRIWANLMKNGFKASNPKSWLLRFHAQTAGVSLQAQQPDNNVVRVAIQALAAVLGGTQSLHTNSKDEALGLPTEEAATLALRTQQIIAHETGAPMVVDPLGGSYFVESLTNKIESEALGIMGQIDQLGGVVRCIENGFFKREIQNSSYIFQKRVDSKEEILVGVNEFIEASSGSKTNLLKVSKKTEGEQVQRLNKYKKIRDQKLVTSSLEKIENAAKSNGNLMPLFISALNNKVTLGEISDSLRACWGVYRENVSI